MLFGCHGTRTLKLQQYQLDDKRLFGYWVGNHIFVILSIIPVHLVSKLAHGSLLKQLLIFLAFTATLSLCSYRNHPNFSVCLSFSLAMHLMSLDTDLNSSLRWASMSSWPLNCHVYQMSFVTLRHDLTELHAAVVWKILPPIIYDSR